MESKDQSLAVAREQMARMERALDKLRDEKHRYSESWFAVFTEGPMREIELLARAMEDLLDKET